MFLIFSKQVFVESMKDRVKVHAIRAGHGRGLQIGTKIHFWLGNPRCTTCKVRPRKFGTGEVSRVESIRMYFCRDWRDGADLVEIGDGIVLKKMAELDALAVNEGFDDWVQMRLWFDNVDREYVGEIIFWKNCNWL
jgi:hypothetical protein